MKKLILTGVVALSVSMAFAQSDVTPNNQDANTRASINGNAINSAINGGTMFHDAKFKYNDLKGSAYLNESWVYGTVVSTANEQTSNLPIRYNTYADEFEFLQGEKAFSITAANVSKIQYGAKTFVYLFGDNKGYYEVLQDGKASLYNKYYTTLKRPSYNAAIDIGAKSDEIVQMTALYVKVGESDVVNIKGTNTKTFAKLFGEQEGKIASFMKAEKLKTKSEEDIKKVLTYYNSL